MKCLPASHMIRNDGKVVARRLLERGPFATFKDLRELTLGLTGPERMALFDDLDPRVQRDMACSVHTAAERERTDERG